MTVDEVMALAEGDEMDLAFSRILFYGIPAEWSTHGDVMTLLESLNQDWAEVHLSKGPRGWSVLAADYTTRRKSVEVVGERTARMALCRAPLLWKVRKDQGER